MDLDLGAARARTGAVGASRRSAHQRDVIANGTCPFSCPRPPLPSNAVGSGPGQDGGQQRWGRRCGGVEVVKVTVALTARARNNIGVQPSLACAGVYLPCTCVHIYARFSICAFVCEKERERERERERVSCMQRARRTHGRFISSSACCRVF